PQEIAVASVVISVRRSGVPAQQWVLQRPNVLVSPRLLFLAEEALEGVQHVGPETARQRRTADDRVLQQTRAQLWFGHQDLPARGIQAEDLRTVAQVEQNELPVPAPAIGPGQALPTVSGPSRDGIERAPEIVTFHPGPVVRLSEQLAVLTSKDDGT